MHGAAAAVGGGPLGGWCENALCALSNGGDALAARKQKARAASATVCATLRRLSAVLLCRWALGELCISRGHGVAVTGCVTAAGKITPCRRGDENRQRSMPRSRVSRERRRRTCSAFTLGWPSGGGRARLAPLTSTRLLFRPRLHALHFQRHSPASWKKLAALREGGAGNMNLLSLLRNLPSRTHLCCRSSSSLLISPAPLLFIVPLFSHILAPVLLCLRQQPAACLAGTALRYLRQTIASCPISCAASGARGWDLREWRGRTVGGRGDRGLLYGYHGLPLLRRVLALWNKPSGRRVGHHGGQPAIDMRQRDRASKTRRTCFLWRLRLFAHLHFTARRAALRC